jgi:hypothetical protein
MGQVAWELPSHLHSRGQGSKQSGAADGIRRIAGLGVARFYAQLIGRPELRGRWMACVSRLEDTRHEDPQTTAGSSSR